MDPPATMVSHETAGGIARIVLDRPERLNAVNAQLVEELLRCLRAAERPEVRAVVLTGRGRAFCAGSDLADNFGEGALPAEANLRASRHPLLLAMRSLRKPIITAVNGVAAGIGISIALAGDLVLARESASFNFAFTRVGLVPDGGATWLLVNAVGRVRAQRITMLAESLSGRQAEAMGLVASCFADADFEREVGLVAERLATGPTLAYALLKESLDAASQHDLPSQLELEARLQARAARSEDFAEGRNAFLQRRKPNFQGS